MAKAETTGTPKTVQAIFQALCLVVIASVVALVFNDLSPKGIPVFPKLRPEGQSSAEIDIDRAFDLYKRRAAVFVDARSNAAYRAGHIPGALNIPFGDEDEFLEPFFEAVPDADALVVTYCEGDGCDLGERLAAMLEGLGYTNVKVFTGGMPQWQKNGYPVETGAKDAS